MGMGIIGYPLYVVKTMALRSRRLYVLLRSLSKWGGDWFICNGKTTHILGRKVA